MKRTIALVAVVAFTLGIVASFVVRPEAVDAAPYPSVEEVGFYVAHNACRQLAREMWPGEPWQLEDAEVYPEEFGGGYYLVWMECYSGGIYYTEFIEFECPACDPI